ncbi:hypothetical protein GGR30_000254 [Martelella radicis]|uniref:Uncharacterized protein n=1 Tax=Martelella radicis TaxID=1397476 RepID=A0A7W6KFM7_9HYPH|nr:hypothetical protein [Martelella radicis]
MRSGTGLIEGVKGRGWQGLHSCQIALQPFSDRLALTAQPVTLALAALFFQKGLDIPRVVALAGAAIAIPDQVVGQEPAEQRRPLARAIRQDLRHKAAVVVIDDRLRHGPEKGERMDVAIDPGLGYRRRISPRQEPPSLCGRSSTRSRAFCSTPPITTGKEFRHGFCSYQRNSHLPPSQTIKGDTLGNL